MMKNNEINPNVQRTLDNLLEGFQLIDKNWRYVYLNQTALLHSRCQKVEDLYGFTMMEKFPGIEKTEMFGFLEMAMHENRHHTMENQFVFADGSEQWFELHIQPAPDGITILSVDISDRKMVELHHKRQKETFEKMLFMCSHHVRRPLANILGLAHILELTMHECQDLNLLHEKIKISAESIDSYLHELSDFMDKVKNQAQPSL